MPHEALREARRQAGKRPKVKGVRAAIRAAVRAAQPRHNRPPAARAKTVQMALLTLRIYKLRPRHETGGFIMCRGFGVGVSVGVC